MKLKLLVLSLLTLSLNAGVKIGKQVPNFCLLDEEGESVTRETLQGKKVALVFYPKNDSYYCTKEVCSLRDGSALLAKNNITVFGVSYDKPKNNKAFKEKYNVPFSILSDTDKSVSKKFGTHTWWTLGFFPKRKTFLINENGILVAILDEVDVEKHAQQIVDSFS